MIITSITITTGNPATDPTPESTHTHTDVTRQTQKREGESLCWKRTCCPLSRGGNLQNPQRMTTEGGERAWSTVRQHFILANARCPCSSFFPPLYRSLGRDRSSSVTITSLYSLSIRTEIRIDFLINISYLVYLHQPSYT